MTGRGSIVCLGCSYSLAGLPAGVCPECERGFDPADPQTYTRPDARVLRRMAEVAPPRWVVWPYGAAAGLWFLAMCSPTGDVAEWTIATWSVLFLFTLLGGVPALLVMPIGRAGLVVKRQRQPRWKWRSIAIPMIFALGVVVQNSGLVWRARWWQARGGFERAATAVGTGGARWMGTYRVEAVEVDPGGAVWFRIGWTDPYSDGAVYIVRSPGASPRFGWTAMGYRGFPIVEDLGGGWWVCFDHT